MDPRKAATVTAPDLLSAFRQDTAGVGEGSGDPSRLRIWLVLFTDGEQATVDETHEFDLAQMDLALQLLKNHLQTGEFRGAALEVASEPPALFRDAVEDGFSQIEA